MTHRTKTFASFFSVLFSFLLTNCGINDSYQKIEKDFYLTCWDEHCKIVLSKADNPSFFGPSVIDQSIFAVGHNSDFIIVKQHPNKSIEIHDRLTNDRNFRWHYKIKDPKDTIFLNPQDSVYYEEGNWFHVKNDWTDPDSLKPYKRITNYYIIDIRWYDEGYKLYSFDNEKDFNKKRFILSVPDDLPYEFYDKTLE